MILCLVGTSPYSFHRLLEYIDNEIACKFEVIIQSGYSVFECKNAECVSFINNDELQIKIGEAELIISQGGYGSLMECLKQNKPVIAVPRLEEFGEIVGDQKELIQYLEKKNYLASCYELEHLNLIIEQILTSNTTFSKYLPESQYRVSDVIEEYITQLDLNK